MYHINISSYNVNPQKHGYLIEYLEEWSIFIWYSGCLLHCLVSGDTEDFVDCTSWKLLKPCKPKRPVRILDSFTIRVFATSGSEVEALAVIHAVQALAAALRINRVLTHLRLRGNDVGVQGAQAHKIANNKSQDVQVWGVSNMQWHVGTMWCRNCQALASAYSALMVNRVVAADWNQAMLGAVVKFGSCNELTVDHIHHLNT